MQNIVKIFKSFFIGAIQSNKLEYKHSWIIYGIISHTYFVSCNAKMLDTWGHREVMQGGWCMWGRGGREEGEGVDASSVRTQVRRFSRASHHSHIVCLLCICVWCHVAFWHGWCLSGVTGTESESCAEGDDTGDELVGDANDDESKCPDCDKPFNNLDMWALQFFSILYC